MPAMIDRTIKRSLGSPGWRTAGDKAREPGVSVRDQLLARLGIDDDGSDDD